MFVLVVPTASWLLRTLVLIAALYGFGTYGIGGLRDSVQSGHLKVLSMDQVAHSGLGGARFLRLSGVATGEYVYVGSHDPAAGGDFIEYALWPASGRTATEPVRVVVSDHFIPVGCGRAADGCLRRGPHTVQGIVHTGPAVVPMEVETALKEAGYTLAPGAALLVAGETPQSVWLPILVMLGLGLVVFLLAVSFVPGVRLW